MASLLSDDELRRKLQLCGVEVGPITATTRRLYVKKLNSFNNNPSLTAAPLSAFSSDDSEVESFAGGSRSPSRKKRHNHRTTTSMMMMTGKDTMLSHHDVFKKPLPTPPRFSPRLNPTSESPPPPPSTSSTVSRFGNKLRRSLCSSTPSSTGKRELRSSFDVETSDSDYDVSELLPSSQRTLKSRSNKSVQSSQNHHHHHVEDRDGEDSGIFRKTGRSSASFVSSTPNGDDLNQKQQIELSRRISNRKSSTSLYNNIKSSKEYNANGYVSDILNGEFQNGKGTGKTTNYSHCVSWMLVLGTAAFFMVIGFFYMSSVKKSEMAANIRQLESHVCPDGMKDDNCIPRDHFNAVLGVSHELYNFLTTAAGEYECQSGRENRSVLVSEAKSSLQQVLEAKGEILPFDEVFKFTILLSQKIPTWGISILLSEDRQMSEISQVIELQDISALESKDASKTLWCRLKHSIQWVLARLVFLLSVVAVVGIIFGCTKFLKRRRELEEKEFYDLVERIIEALQEQSADDSNSSQSGVMPSRAIVHLRDSLIPPKDRRAKQQLWDRAVAFIEENESRVQVDYERIGGEEFKVWRWMSNPASDAEGGKHGKVWQGQAFGNTSKGKNHVQYSPTPCLKIRNMFDPEVEYGDDWQISVQDAILEKCEGNDGIVHIAVDTSSEGCIYMLCNSCEAAGKAYSALHGWWFDGKLVTVKYLRFERYLERYPSAENCVMPLKPSNNKRLSLSTPFFSSALERS